MPSIKQQIDSRLAVLKQTNQALYELTSDLSLLHVINNMTFDVSQAIEKLSEQGENLTDDEYVILLADSEAIEILDEIVDTDSISELENTILTAIDNIEDSVLGEFLTELLEKIELRHAALVESIHELNALLNNFRNP